MDVVECTLLDAGGQWRGKAASLALGGSGAVGGASGSGAVAAYVDGHEVVVVRGVVFVDGAPQVLAPGETREVGADTVVVGHSSGAVAARRLAEETPVAALVLVSACHTDLATASLPSSLMLSPARIAPTARESSPSDEGERLPPRR